VTATVPVVQFTVAGAGIPDGVGVGLGRPYTVVYDGHCNVCGKLVRALAAWDRQGLLELVPSQAAGVHARFPWIPAGAYMDSVQLIGPGGATWQGAAAVERILDVMPRGRWLTWVFSIPFVRTFAEGFYRWFARNRYRLGCGEHCEYRPPAVDFGDGT
jgi:predicted DCC family thiol-disulfide oxidoreductase YuxK